MTYCGRISIIGMLLAAPPLAAANEPGFAELLARAQAEMAAGHTVSPPGDNVSETFLSMINVMEQATPEQLVVFDALLRQLKSNAPWARDPPANVAATSSGGSQAKDALPSAPDLTASTAAIEQGDHRTDMDQTKSTAGVPAPPELGSSGNIISPPVVLPDAASTPAFDALDLLIAQANQQHSPAAADSATSPHFSEPTRLATAKAPSSPVAAMATTAGLHPEPADPPQAQTLPLSVQRTLLDRGDTMLKLNDVTASRLLYQRAADGGVGIAAFKLAQTFDPFFLAAHNLRGFRADPAAAEAWYRKAEALGDEEAIESLRKLTDQRSASTVSQH